MGYKNERDLRWRGRHLRSVNAFKVLCQMAYVSMDDDEEPFYNGGWELLALACGYDIGDAVGPLEGRRKTAMNAVNTACSLLVQEGLIRLATKAAPGRNARWILHVTPEKSGSEPAVDNPAPVQPSPRPSLPRTSGPNAPENPGTDAPENPGPSLLKTSGPEENRRRSGGEQAEENMPGSQPDPGPRDPDPVENGEGDIAQVLAFARAEIRGARSALRDKGHGGPRPDGADNGKAGGNAPAPAIGNADATHVKEQ